MCFSLKFFTQEGLREFTWDHTDQDKDPRDTKMESLKTLSWNVSYLHFKKNVSLDVDEDICFDPTGDSVTRPDIT